MFAKIGAKSEHLLRVATKVREWQMERNILGILKRITPLLAGLAAATLLESFVVSST
jgi:hypothetical protein